MNLQGCGTALITPFRQDQSIDEKALRDLVEWQISSGIHFLVPCGTTGETPTLSKDEWLRVIDITIEVAAGEKARELGRRKGVDAILTASPYYNKPTQEGQYQHFKAIAEAVEKPLVLYSVVGRTAANIEPATLGRLARIPNIIAVKEASGNIGQIAEVFNHVPESFLVFSGDDVVTLPVIALGGVGIISVCSNEIPREMSELTAAALKNDWVKARRLQRQYLRLMQANFLESNPMPVKCVLAMMGRIEEVLRLPMLPVKPETRSRLEKIAAEAELLQVHASVSDL
jgi:4-hydroxy-tetrahydrodipicolinate synthase